MHEEIILAIARAYPCSIKDVYEVFDIVKSYDDTIKAINVSRSVGMGMDEIARISMLGK